METSVPLLMIILLLLLMVMVAFSRQTSRWLANGQVTCDNTASVATSDDSTLTKVTPLNTTTRHLRKATMAK